MGNKNSKTNSTKSPQTIFSKILLPLPDSYIPLQSQPSILQHPQQPSLRTYIILLNGDQQESCIRSLNLRKKYPQQLIQIKYGNLLTSQKQYIKIKVYVQHIALNLQQIINVHFSDMMPIFYKVFKGFKILYEQFGSFAPDPRMIGFNQLAEVKVWAHTKYSKSKPQISYQMYNQQKMIQSLIQIFSNKIDIATLPIDSHRRKFTFNAKTFDQAISYIQKQVQSMQLIPKNIKSIGELLNSGRKINENQIISMNSEYYNKNIQKIIKFKYSDPDLKNSNKVKVNFARQSKSPKKISTSVPKINFTTSTTPRTNVSFTAISPNNGKIISNQSSRIVIPSPNTQKIKITYQNPQSIKIIRSTSLVKFTYK